MADVDIPFLDESVVSLPSDIRADLAARCAGDLFAFSKFVLGNHDMTVRAHGPMCVFLDHNPKQILACGMPRGTFKTTVGTIARNLQGVVQNPNRTRLIANENSTNASRFLSAIRQHAENNKVFRALYSSVIPKDTRKVHWNDQELVFNRDVVRPEPTIDTIGMMGAWTSRHFDEITFDDIISEEASKSEKVMADVTDRAKKYRALFVSNEDSKLTLLFTRWLFGDTYAQLFELMGDNCAKMIRGAIEDDGPIFPERLSLKSLTAIRKEIGEYAFSCLYMNSPRNEDVQDFNVKDLRFWEFRNGEREVALLDVEGRVFRHYRLDQLDITATVDLAAAEKSSSDRNAVTVCGITPTNEAVVLECWAKRCTPLELMRFVFFCQRRWEVRKWGIEDVAYQAAFKYFVRDYADREDLYLNIVPIKSIKAKHTRIRGLQPIAATHRLYISPTQHILRNELAAFPLGGEGHDDTIDSLSMQLQLWQGQMSLARWNKYKEAERNTLAEIDRQNRLTSGALSSSDSDNEGIDFEPTEYFSYELPEVSSA